MYMYNHHVALHCCTQQAPQYRVPLRGTQHGGSFQPRVEEWPWLRANVTSEQTVATSK